MKLGDALSYGDDLAWRLGLVIVTPSFCAHVGAARGARRGLAPWLSLEGNNMTSINMKLRIIEL